MTAGTSNVPFVCNGNSATALIVRRRVDLMLSLPMAPVDSISRQHAVRNIGDR